MAVATGFDSCIEVWGGAMRWPLRPLNECRTCGYRWYPRGHGRSYQCPRCASNSVIISPIQFIVPGILIALAAYPSRSKLFAWASSTTNEPLAKLALFVEWFVGTLAGFPVWLWGKTMLWYHFLVSQVAR